MILDINDYDLSKIRKSLDQIVFNISNLASIRLIAQEAREQKQAYALVAPIGCGVKTAFHRIKEESKGTVVVVEQHAKGKAQNMLGDIARQSNPLFKKFDWDSCSPADLLDCIKFLCTNYFKDPLFLIHGCSNYTTHDFQLLHDLVKSTSKKAGILFSLNPKRAKKLDNEATRIDDIQKFLYHIADWPQFTPPPPEEMAVIVHAAGIENPSIIDQIILSSNNLHELRYRITRIRNAVLKLSHEKY